MKKIVILLLLAALLLTACQSQPRTITIDRDAGTLSDGTYTYEYTEEKYDNYHSITIYYPDGCRYYWTDMGTEVIEQGEYDGYTYASAQQLLDTIQGTVIIGQPEQSANVSDRVYLILLAVVLVGLGLWETARPEQSWYLAHGWKYKDAEPSDVAIGLIRGMGILELVFAAILVIVLLIGVV